MEALMNKHEKKEKSAANNSHVLADAELQLEKMLINYKNQSMKKSAKMAAEKALSGSFGKDTAVVCDSSVSLENIEYMTQSQLNSLSTKMFLRLILTCVEVAMALANVTGSQSDLIHMLMCFVFGQLIFRFYEIVEMVSPTAQIDCSLYHIQSSSGLVIFVQMTYMLTTFPYFHGEKLTLNEYYSGELCSLLHYYKLQRYILVASYLYAITLKLYNTYFFIFTEMHIKAR